MASVGLVNEFICDDAERGAKRISKKSVSVIVTSPPYYKQRDYGSPGQLGNEKSPQMYVEKLVKIFRECRRTLSDEGTLWLNLGDKYLNGQLLGLPWRVAFALQDDGWILRSDIIWHKPNAMPSSVRRRPTTDHEYIFLFSKKSNYYYDADAIREPHVTFTEQSKMKGGRNHFNKRGGTPELGKNSGNPNLHNSRWDQAFHPKGRNRRTVWQIPLSKFPGTHFAVFPEKLVELCVKAGSPEGGVVLDPFSGSGTTAFVSRRLGRNYIGIDCNPQYCDMAKKRIGQQLVLTEYLDHASEDGD
ncbi:MAG: site-specific DNA-methyltransferase [Rubrobacteraceae bacterium]